MRAIPGAPREPLRGLADLLEHVQMAIARRLRTAAPARSRRARAPAPRRPGGPALLRRVAPPRASRRACPPSRSSGAAYSSTTRLRADGARRDDVVRRESRPSTPRLARTRRARSAHRRATRRPRGRRTCAAGSRRACTSQLGQRDRQRQAREAGAGADVRRSLRAARTPTSRATSESARCASTARSDRGRRRGALVRLESREDAAELVDRARAGPPSGRASLVSGRRAGSRAPVRAVRGVNPSAASRETAQPRPPPARAAWSASASGGAAAQHWPARSKCLHVKRSRSVRLPRTPLEARERFP